VTAETKGPDLISPVESVREYVRDNVACGNGWLMAVARGFVLAVIGICVGIAGTRANTEFYFPGLVGAMHDAALFALVTALLAIVVERLRHFLPRLAEEIGGNHGVFQNGV